MILTIEIQGRGICEQVELFSPTSEHPPAIPVEIKIDGRPILYEEFLSFIRSTISYAKYIRCEGNGEADVSVFRKNTTGAVTKYFIGDLTTLDVGFFIKCAFPNHGRRSWVILTFDKI
jgi:hypothetical protein